MEWRRALTTEQPMYIRKSLARLEQQLEARESERRYTMVVAIPSGGQYELRPPGVYVEGRSVTVIYEGPEPDEKVMAALVAKRAPGGCTVICERDLGHNDVDPEDTGETLFGNG